MPKLERLNVSKTDLANLSESGLKRDTIRANGLRTEGGALVFPYRDLDGNEDGFTRKRPHVPRVKDGREIKYEQPKGEACRAYFPAASLPMLRDGTSPIYVTEGEKKALALSQLGLASIGIGGVWCWKIKDTENLIPDLEAVAWQGRDVYIVFDHDEKPKTQRSVEYARQRLARALRASGAQEVYNVELPPGPDGGKMGVDDYIVWQGETAFSELVSASQPIPVGVRPMRVPAGRTDAANAARLIDRYGSEIRWVGPWDKWLLWDGQRWCIDDSRRIEHHGKEIANRLWKELGEDISKGDIVKEALTAMYAFAKSSNNAGGVRAMVSLAKSEPGVVVSPDKLDADPWLLNVENGTLDLRTGKLRDHRQEDFLTKLAPVTFDPAAECPLWLAFLDRIFAGNQELIGYLQRLAGYNLTGVTHEHILPFLFGDGSNGKSTFCETLLSLLGKDYAMKAPPDLLMVRRGETHPTDRADLFGKRFVACVETEDGRRLAEALVKELTGGDRVRARRMREDFWEFTPTHHVWLAGNYKPTVKGTDHGIWRRIKLIPFEVKIPDGEQDKRLKDKLAAELPGILNWAVQGCLDWQRDGMREPEIVQAATQEYSDEMDLVGRFIEEWCEVGPEYVTSASELYQSFGNRMPDIHMSQHSFGAYLARRGFEKRRTNKGQHGWKGLRLKSTGIIESIKAKKGGK